MRRPAGFAGLLVGLILLATGGAQAHPHIYVVYSVVLPLGPRGVEGVGFVFTFDPLFSAILLRDAGQGDPDIVSRQHVRMLAQIPHEIEISFNGTLLSLGPPTDLRVTTAGSRVTYRFVMPLSTPLLPPGTIDIAVDDPGVFAAFVLHTPDSVEIQASGPFTATCARSRTSTGAPGPLRCEYADAKQ